jgi:hypothetical protein
MGEKVIDRWQADGLLHDGGGDGWLHDGAGLQPAGAFSSSTQGGGRQGDLALG